jgi:NAD(P)-dependent dehydrogenase (short-subunit alcohol dehydrogenase family)
MKPQAAKALAHKARLARTPLVVLGATGGVGRGVVAAALAAGRPVIAVARDKGGLQCLRSQYADADLTIVPGSVSSDADGDRLARALRKLGRPIGGVIAAVSGGVSRGRLLDHPAAYLRERLDEDLLPHLAAARHLLPLLAEADRGGTYVLIGGPGADQPWAGYGHRSIATAALRMLARVLHEEARSLGVRVQLLAIESPVCTELNRTHACEQWPSALAVGQRAVALVDPSGTKPAQAVVRYGDVVPAAMDEVDIAGDVTCDVDSPSSDSTNTQGTGQADAAPASGSEPDSDRGAAADADAGTPQPRAGDAGLLTSRCLQDARTLLRSLIPTSDNHNNQERSS